MPRATRPQLLGATVGGQMPNWVQFAPRQRRPQPIGHKGTVCVTHFKPLLDPHLANVVFEPICKQADAVSLRHHGIKMGLELGKRQILIDNLLYLETWLHPERELCHHAQRAQPHHRAIKGRAERVGRHRHKLTRRRH